MQNDQHDVDERVAESKARLNDKLHELGDRLDAAKEAVQPSQLIRRPWVQFGIAAFAGYLLGSRGPRLGPAILAPLVKEAVLILGSTALQKVARQYLRGA